MASAKLRRKPSAVGLMTDAILQVEDLYVQYPERSKRIRAVDGVSFSLRRGSTLALVGESGSGKTTAALAVMGLLPHPGQVTGGVVRFEDEDLLALQSERLRRLRGRAISMIFQDPVSGLNPVLSIGQQVEEIITAHHTISSRDAKRIALETLERVGLSDPEQLTKRYPHELSGGMSQRIAIAIATVLNPAVIIADEPTSSLDMTVQAGILNELERLRAERGTSILLITHDFGVVAQMADDVAVMYAGRIAERGTAHQVLRQPRHPYTWGLLRSLPRVDRRNAPLETIKGAPPDLAELPEECAFVPRCLKALNQCRTSPSPPLTEHGRGQLVACYNPVYQHDG